MDAQTKMNGSGANGAAESVVGSIADFGNDVASLAELQLRLVALDFKETTDRAVGPLVLLVLGLIVVLGSVPVAVGGLALLVAERFSLSHGAALLATSAATTVLAGLLAVWAGRRFLSTLESFRRSREELVRNVNWIRTVLVHSGRPTPKSPH